MMDSQEILKLILPTYLVEHFNITKVEELETKLHIYFEEKNNYGNQWISDKSWGLGKKSS
ncbi:hypothetical protein HMPREF9711_02002 [Myroides odoratimimus CCUG 3837]|uniref:hypothetical protein n=1 Tax=Myroides odoratimimus TaxID=76832 RepID=UPI000280AC18|nr:hypothetical protein [Myroides odoratimimus]EKB04673.1 hypothetical protein HMPREF9711_02002 [Myroides odoratimimus CCUG 3837]